MGIDKRCKDFDWDVNYETTERYRPELALLAVLMDIRDELKELNNKPKRKVIDVLPEKP